MAGLITKAIILAAGAATRLRPLTEHTPKCLLPIAGSPLLRWTLDAVVHAGMAEVAVVTGFESERIRTFLKNNYPFHRIRFISNPYYHRTNNAYSLLLARRFLEDRAGRIASGFLLLDSDIMFDRRILSVLREHPADNRLAVRVRGVHNEEEIRVEVDELNRVKRIGKDVPAERTFGESIGIEMFSQAAAARLYEVLEHRVRSGGGRTEFYEASFQVLIDEGCDLRAVDIGELPVVEIDTPADLQEAQQLAARFASSPTS